MDCILTFDESDNTRWSVYDLERFLLNVSDKRKRSEMVREFGNSLSSIADYEKGNRLPRGAFELVVMLDSEIFTSSCEQIRSFRDKMTADMRPSAVKNNLLRDRVHQLNAQIIEQYPDAYRFLCGYTAVVQQSVQTMAASSDSVVVYGVLYNQDYVVSEDAVVYHDAVAATESAVATDVGAVYNLLIAASDTVAVSEVATISSEAAYVSNLAYATNQAAIVDQVYAVNQQVGVSQSTLVATNAGVVTNQLVATNQNVAVDQNVGASQNLVVWQEVAARPCRYYTQSGRRGAGHPFFEYPARGISFENTFAKYLMLCLA